MILDKIEAKDKEVVEKNELVNWMKAYAGKIDKEFGEVIITAGAGDIDTLLQPLKEIIENA
jgi:UDP-N-acetylmuramate--alanine ligase